jgi:hypothetical protein
VAVTEFLENTSAESPRPSAKVKLGYRAMPEIENVELKFAVVPLGTEVGV